MNYEQANFLKLLAGPALEAERDWSVPAAVTIAQGIIEGAGRDAAGVWHWGYSPLARFANNPFGIKYSHSLTHTGRESYGEFDARTTEFSAVDGRAHPALAAFEKFFSLNAAIRAHTVLFWTSRYENALAAGQKKDWRGFCQALMECGYSTDRPELCRVNGCQHYANKLIRIIERYHLDDPNVLRAYALGSHGLDRGSVAGVRSRERHRWLEMVPYYITAALALALGFLMARLLGTNVDAAALERQAKYEVLPEPLQERVDEFLNGGRGRPPAPVHVPLPGFHKPWKQEQAATVSTLKEPTAEKASAAATPGTPAVNSSNARPEKPTVKTVATTSGPARAHKPTAP